MKFSSTTAAIFAICTLASASPISIQQRQDMMAAVIADASAGITTAFSAVTPEAKGDGGLASNIVQTVADGLGLGTLQGGIVNSVAAGLRDNGL